jgi:parallel beta-helix repeat protein
MSDVPAAFMSYARFNDEHDDGQLSAFRERLAAEVRAQTGREFVIFQDRDISWGQNWQQRIDGALDVVTLLLAVITPGFFASQACREELARFLARERQMGRGDLILPVYYISAREMDDPAVRASDELARVLASRQFADWRELRFEPLASPLVRKSVAQLASRMRDTFWHPADVPARPTRGARRRGEAIAQAVQEPGTASRVTAKTEPPTHVVDVWGRGDFPTVSAAIRAAKPGDRIVVRPGLYEEGLVVDKPLEILGDGPAGEVEIRVRGTNVLLFKASIGRVANLTLRQAGGEGKWFGVDITQGRLDLEGCDISSQSLACVAIHDSADPRLRRNQIHDGKQVGVLVYDDGLGTLEDNDITGNALSGVEIMTGGNPTLRRNQIHDNKEVGVAVHDDGLGTLEDNDITANTKAGLGIVAGGNPTLRRNRVNRNGFAGVWIYDGGRGRVEDNDLTGNIHGAWNIAAYCEADVLRARNLE